MGLAPLTKGIEVSFSRKNTTQYVITSLAVVLITTGVVAVTPWEEPPTGTDQKDSAYQVPAPLMSIVPDTLMIPRRVPEKAASPSSQEGSHTGSLMAAAKTYRVRSGDTLGAIAKAWRTNAQALARINGITDPNRLSIGQLIKRTGKPQPIRKTSPITNSQPVHYSGKIETVIAFARAQLGDPYVWGAAGPSSWDCSGLVMKAYAQVGINLPHSSRGMYGYGSSVSRSNLRPGDLLFYGYSAGSIHHVALYIGGGLVLHASTSGQPVKIVPLSRTGRDYFGARRLI